jgi:hypothetical protein
VFIGHAAMGFAAKRAAPRASLGWLLVAPWLLDVLWPTFLLLGIERVRIAPGITAFGPLDFTWYPWSHSLVMTLLWAVLTGGIYRAMTRDRSGAWVIGGLVASHWVLDAIAHRPDLPIAPWLPIKIGLGLWYSVAATFIVEGALFVVGVILYLGATRARDRWGAVGLWSLVLFLVAIYVSSESGPPPPNATAIAVVTLVGEALILVWAMWIERHRVLRTQVPS